MKLILKVLTFSTIYYKIENSPNTFAPNISLNVYLLFIYRVGCIHRWHKNRQTTDLKTSIHFSSGIKVNKLSRFKINNILNIDCQCTNFEEL